MSNHPPDPWSSSETDPLIRSLRGALAREADQVTPGRDGLHRIRTEIESRERASAAARRLWLTGLAAAVAGILVTGGLVTALNRNDSGGGPVAIDTASAAPTTPVSPGLPVYYCGTLWQLDRLFREFHPVTGTADPTGTTSERVQAAVTQAMSERPDDPDYQTLWPSGAGARTTVETDLITIVLNRAAAAGITLPPDALSTEGNVIDQQSVDAAALQQLIWTATAAAAPSGSTGPVRVRISTEGPNPNRFGSISLEQPFRRGTRPGDQDPRAMVWIDSLGQDAVVPVGRLTVHGQSTGASLPLRWTLVLGGKTVDSGEITPTAADGGELGIGVRGEWTTTVDLPTSGRYRLAVTLDVDDGGGGTDTKDLVVKP